MPRPNRIGERTTKALVKPFDHGQLAVCIKMHMVENPDLSEILARYVETWNFIEVDHTITPGQQYFVRDVLDALAAKFRILNKGVLGAKT